MRTNRLMALALCVFIGGCQSEGVLFEPYIRSDTENALVYVYWPPQSWREKADEYPELRLNGVSVGVLKYRTYLVLEVPPGRHNFLLTGDSEYADWEDEDISLTLPLKPGETEYLRFLVKFNQTENRLGQGKMKYVIQFLPISTERALVDLAELHAASD
ncbi:MAG: DUF2846 domain-containing protein [Gammaproteobacteria bacterium]|nr:DUF2846 domain-containing protein [Gammaproteobacteria bacterium]